MIAGVLEEGSDAQGMAASGATLCTLGFLIHRWRPLIKQVGAGDPRSGDSPAGLKSLAVAIALMLGIGLLGRVNGQSERHNNWLYRVNDRLDDVESQVNELEYERYR